jgi:hypothetical protein
LSISGFLGAGLISYTRSRFIYFSYYKGCAKVSVAPLHENEYDRKYDSGIESEGRGNLV